MSLSWASSIHPITPHPTSWRSILILSFVLYPRLPSGLFPSGFLTKTLYTPLLSPIRATYPANIILGTTALKYTTETLVLSTLTSQSTWFEATWKVWINKVHRLLFQDHTDVFITTEEVALQHSAHASPLQDLPPVYHGKLQYRIQKRQAKSCIHHAICITGNLM